MAFKLFVGALILLLVVNLILAITKPKWYGKNLESIRKGLYTFFAISLLVGLLVEEIKLQNWSFILILVSVIVFVDISAFLTPKISKFFQTEFAYHELTESLFDKSEKTILGMINRVQKMSKMIQYVEVDLWHVRDEDEDEDEQVQIPLDVYLAMYSDEFGFNVHIFELDMSRSSETSEKLQIRKAGIEDRLRRFRLLYTLEAPQNWNDSLMKSAVVSTEDEKFMIVPIFMQQREMLVVLIEEKGNLMTIDATHITNLIYMYYENQ